MRISTVSVLALSLVILVAFNTTTASSAGKKKAINRKGGAGVSSGNRRLPNHATKNPPFDFIKASMAEKVLFLAQAGEAQAAVEHFFAMPKDASKGNVYGCNRDVFAAYTKSMELWVSFVSDPDEQWEDFTAAEKTRAFWGDRKIDSVITQYEASEECKADSRATAAYLDAKLLKAFNFAPASMEEKVLYLERAGSFQAAIEHFFAMPKDESKRNFYGCDSEVRTAYLRSMEEFVVFYGAEGDVWDNYTCGQRTRAFWTNNRYDAVVNQYESSETCKTDSRATAAYLDAKLLLASPQFMALR